MTRSTPPDASQSAAGSPLSVTHPSSPEGKRKDQGLEPTQDSGVQPGPRSEADRGPEPPPESAVGGRQGAPPVTSVGRYDLVRQLGLGGMGTVYEGVHRDLRKRAAIKILHPQLAQSRGVRTRFLREGQAASRVRHPNVVDVYDVGVEDDVLYLVMELLVGESLVMLLRRHHRLPPERVVDLVVPVVAALAAAHDLGVVHRDLKPENVFLCRERGGVRPKVLDFGISKIIDVEAGGRLTGTEAFLGTPFYMSPEQAQNVAEIDGRTDQYSLGVLMYEALTGRRPFEASTLYALMSAIVAGRCEPLRAIEPAVPAALADVVTRAMAPRADDRYPDVRALGVALLPFASERVRLLYTQELTAPELVRPSSSRDHALPSSVPVVPGSALATGDRIVAPAPARSSGRWLWVAVIGGALPVLAVAVLLAVRPGASASRASEPAAAEGAAALPLVAAEIQVAPTRADERAMEAPAAAAVSAASSASSRAGAAPRPAPRPPAPAASAPPPPPGLAPL